MKALVVQNPPFFSLPPIRSLNSRLLQKHPSLSVSFRSLSLTDRFSFRPHRLIVTASSASMETKRSKETAALTISDPPMKLLFVEMGVGYDQHGQDITAAAMRACRDAISSNSIPAFRRGSIPGVTFDEMKLQIKLGVPRCLQQSLDTERVKTVFPYGKILSIEVVEGGLICSSGVHVEEMGDKSDDCYIMGFAGLFWCCHETNVLMRGLGNAWIFDFGMKWLSIGYTLETNTTWVPYKPKYFPNRSAHPSPTVQLRWKRKKSSKEDGG